MSYNAAIEYCKLDNNGRFKLPIAIKKQLEEGNCSFFIRPSIYSPCLELWQSGDFQKEKERLERVLDSDMPEERALLRKLQAAKEVEMDASDRLVIPTEQRTVLSDGKNLVVQPVSHWIEIWDYDTYMRETNSETVDYVGLAVKYFGRKSQSRNNEES